MFLKVSKKLKTSLEEIETARSSEMEVKEANETRNFVPHASKKWVIFAGEN